MKTLSIYLSAFASLAAVSAQAAVRGPVAVVVEPSGRYAFTANRNGSVTTIDVAAKKVVQEAAIGRRLSDVAIIDGGRRLLAVDEAAGELIVLSVAEGQVAPQRRVAVSRGPVCVRTLQGSRCAVSCLWDRQVCIVDVGAPASSEAPRIVHAVALPFNPRLLLPLAEGARLLVADAFGGRLAVIDTAAGRVDSLRSIPGHNLRGLATSPDGRDVWIAHLQLSSDAETTLDNLHWGNLLTTDVRGIAVDALLDPRGDIKAGMRLYPMSQTGHGAGDPAGVASSADGTLVMALSGAGEVSIGPVWEQTGRRVKVGALPLAVALTPDGRTACVADPLDDTLTLVDVSHAVVSAGIRFSQSVAPDAVARGERLFYNATLSHEQWISCHSCHTDGHTTGLRADTRGDGSFGAPKRTPTLLGVASSGPWAWDASAVELTAQLRRTLESTMHVEQLSESQLSDLAAFLQTLAPPPPAEVIAATDAALVRGRASFERHNCADCHAGSAFTSAGPYDVGLVDEVGRREFNPPSLRGVGHAAALYHDGRARSLEEVFTFHPHATTGDVPPAERADLLRYLRSL